MCSVLIVMAQVDMAPTWLALAGLSKPSHMDGKSITPLIVDPAATGVPSQTKAAIAELDLLWRREMVTLSYRASWLNFHTGSGTKRAISFVSRPDRPNYAAPMSLDEEADIIASAAGFIGPCRDYLFDTVEALAAEGILDPHLEKLQRAVRHRVALNGGVG